MKQKRKEGGKILIPFEHLQRVRTNLIRHLSGNNPARVQTQFIDDAGALSHIRPVPKEESHEENVWHCGVLLLVACRILRCLPRRLWLPCVILVDAYPAQGATLTAQRNAALVALALTENVQSVSAGVSWGQTVADAMWAWRLTDGNAPAPPPFLGVLGIVGTLNVAMADAAIACWDSKYRYAFWRPITAIRAGLTPTHADPAWEPWLDFFKAGARLGANLTLPQRVGDADDSSETVSCELLAVS